MEERKEEQRKVSALASLTFLTLASLTFLTLGNLQASLHCTRLIEKFGKASELALHSLNRKGIQMLILHGAGLQIPPNGIVRGVGRVGGVGGV